MVSKKYLCAAPRLDSWKERSEALLKSLGGDEKKREKALRQALDSLKAIHEEKKRSGPGRKSNAEHAIAFYEYMLQGFRDSNAEGESEVSDENEDKEEGDEENENSSGEGEKDEDDAIVDSKKAKTKARLKGGKPNAEVSSSDSSDTQDFLDQHNDICDVCNKGGELLCCSTCNLVFHTKCVRPTLHVLPDGDWSCAHCIVQGVRGYKRHSKTYRAAAAGVRHMRKLKSLENNEENGESAKTEGGAKSKKARCDLKPHTVRVPRKELDSSTKDQSDSKGQEHAKELEQSKKIDKDSAVEKAAEESTPSRTRRQRKQPVLFNPQNCADSEWQSDEKHGRVDSGSDSSDDDETGAKGKARDQSCESANRKRKRGGRSEEKGSESSFWCNFCKDDPAIAVCCFCACRVCFGKHAQTQLLICDHCHDEYHTFCLKPPLKMIPASKKWFCPSCQRSKKISGATATRRTKTPISEVTEIASSPNTRVATRTSLVPSTSLPSILSPTNRSKSRPAKVKIVVPSTPVSPAKAKPLLIKSRSRSPRTKPTSPVAPSTSISPRKRSRPLKDSVSSPEPSPSPAQKKRGRSLKLQSLSLTTPSKRVKVQSPEKSPEAMEPSIEEPSQEPHEKTKKFKDSAERSSSSSNSNNSNEKVKMKIEGTSLSSSDSNRASEKPDLSEKTGDDPSTPESRTIKQSRSGRIVRRTSFHDEIEEGEQHLRSDRTKDEAKAKEHQEIAIVAKPESSTRTTPKIVEDEDISLPKPARAMKKIELPSEPPAVLPPVLPALFPSMSPSLRPTTPPVMSVPAGTPSTTKPATKSTSLPTPSIAPTHPQAPPLRPLKLPTAPPTTAVVAAPKTKEAVPIAPPPPSSSPSPATTTVTSTQYSIPHTLPPAKLQIKQEYVPMRNHQITPSSNRAPDSLEIAPAAAARTVGIQRDLTTKSAAITPKVPPASLAAGGPPIASRNAELVPSARTLVESIAAPSTEPVLTASGKVPRRKPGARECMQISRRFGNKVIPQKYMNILLDYCKRGKVEHLIRMRERLDEHSRYLESQLAGLESQISEKGETNIVVPPLPEPHEKPRLGGDP